MLDDSVLPTLHSGGEGQNVYRMISSNACDQGFLRGEMVKCKLVLDDSVLSTLHRGGEGQNVYRMIFFSNPCD